MKTNDRVAVLYSHPGREVLEMQFRGNQNHVGVEEFKEMVERREYVLLGADLALSADGKRYGTKCVYRHVPVEVAA